MKKQQILLISSNPVGWESTNKYGGGEIITKNFTDNITNFNYKVLSVSPNPFVNNQHINVTNLTLPFRQNLNFIKTFLDFLIWGYKTITWGTNKKNSFDIVYASTTNISDFVPALIIAKLTQKKLITKLHISIYNGNGKFLAILKNIKLEKYTTLNALLITIPAYITLKLLRFADLVICTSELLEYSLISTGINKDKVCVIENGIDINKINKVISDSYKNKIYDLCFVARLTKYKGIYEFVKIVKILKNINPNIKAIVIGQGPEQQNIKNLIIKYKLQNNVKLLGFLKDERFKFMAKSKYLLALSVSSEGYGLTIAEGLVCKTKVIALQNSVLQNVYKSYSNVTFANDIEGVIKNIDLGNYIATNINISEFDIAQKAKEEEKIIETKTKQRG